MSKPCAATNGRTIGNGGIASGWKSSGCSTSGKKCANASGGSTNDMSRKCGAWHTKANGNGDIASGWKNSGMNMKCGR